MSLIRPSAGVLLAPRGGGRLQRFGVLVISAAETNGDGAIAEFIRGQLALVAQLERAMILDRVRAGKAKRKLQGRHVHGRIPYGLRSAGQGVPVVDDEQAAVVRRIFTDARDGYSPGRIARDLNGDGIASPSGGAWGEMAVRRIVVNEV